MRFRLAWRCALASVLLGATALAAGRAPGVQPDPGVQVPRVTTAMTDKDVEPFGLTVYWKALCVLGEFDEPTGIYPIEDDVYLTDTYTRLACYNAKDGVRRWIKALDRIGQPQFEPAPFGPDVFTVAGGSLICLDRQSGNERWRTRTKNIPCAGPAVGPDYVYVAGADGWLRAFSKRTHEEAW